jgi:ubiquinone/menaquinone biosynthesis C-methylase UbiE
MRAIAAAEYPHPGVHYLAGRAEAIPLATASCDAVAMFFVLHHIADLQAAALEMSRVLRVGGHVLPTLATATAVFESAGFTVIGLAEVEHEIADDLTAYGARLACRAISTLEYLTEDEVNEGLSRLSADAAVESEPHPVRHVHDLLTLSLASRP